MDRINVIAAINVTRVKRFRDNFKKSRFENRKRQDFSDKKERELRLNFTAGWKTFKPPKSEDTYKIIEFYVDDEHKDKKSVLSSIKELASTFPKKSFIIVGAWSSNGLHYGQSLSYDERGNEIVKGRAVYPMKKWIRLFMPDDVTYDKDGSEKTRVPATKNKQVHKLAGRQDRRY